MGLLTQLIKGQAPGLPLSTSPGIWQSPITGGAQNYQQFARKGYAANEIVFAAIELLATSAAEPHIIGRRWRRESPRFRGLEEAGIREELRLEVARMKARGIPVYALEALLIKNGFVIQLPDHPLVKLLNAPNPFMSRGQLWSTITMDRYLGGNAYLLKARNRGLGNVQELWRLRPDRVRIIPDRETFCKYEYGVGRDKVVFPYRDVIHFKTRNPLDDYYGMPPLMAVSGRLDIDSYMRGFLQKFFERGGTGPGAVLSVKQKLSDVQKEQIAEQAKTFQGPGGWFRWMIMDNAEHSFTQLGLQRGLRDALPKELNEVQEARIAMVFGIPGSILGLLIGYESSSYANKRADREVFWKITMAPLLSDLDDVLNLHLTGEFGAIDEVLFDLWDIEALQEEVDKVHERARKNFMTGGWSLQEFREVTGKDPENLEGTFYVPANVVPLRGRSLNGGAPLQQPEPLQMLRALLAAPPLQIEGPDLLSEAHCPSCGRWLGRNMNVGAVTQCPKCNKEVEVTS